MRSFLKPILFYTSLLGVVGCIEPFVPDNISQPEGIIVIDGFVNTTAQTASVAISHANALTSSSEVERELGASVIIEKENSTQYTLAEKGNGIYQLEGINFDKVSRYRLLVTTSNGSSYFSDYIELTATPPIDSVTWRAKEEGIEILVNTHDQNENSKYFRWTYEETWEYNAPFFSSYKMVNGEAFERAQDDRIYNCWDSHKSTGILVANSIRLSSNIISDFPLTFVSASSIKLNNRYSILVQQQTLTKEAYEFWSQLEKTSEDLGGLFDSQPYQLLGNIHSESNADVLGYFSGGLVSEERIFIDYQELTYSLLALRPRPICNEQENIDSLYLADLPTTPNSVLLKDPIYQRGVGIIGYTWAESICLDCRLRGGTLQRPDFW
ncbi:MAG: DUF4249 domain-containing protein [Chryseolinea sp.]